MALRMMQVFLPGDDVAKFDEQLEGREVLGRWRDSSVDQTVLHLLLAAEEAEPIMDLFEQSYAGVEGFHVLLLPVEAVLPRPKAEPDEIEQVVADEVPEARSFRISREELYAAANESLGLDRIFLGLTILSAVVAAVGLIRNDVAVIIGAMVIAPLLGPNVAMSLATTLGDLKLLRRAALTNLAGIASAFLFAVLVGVLFTIDPKAPAIVSRTTTGFGDVLLALAAGAAGTLAFTRGQTGAVIGVMVAVALMPPVVACGMLVGAGDLSLAYGAFLLTTANLICINLAGVLTFLAQGVHPRNWWEAEIARKAIRKAILMWLVLLAVLLAILWFSRIGFDL
jgi:uncharacterized hydrophobic protein (TIGR00341 family)